MPFCQSIIGLYRVREKATILTVLCHDSSFPQHDSHGVGSVVIFSDFDDLCGRFVIAWDTEEGVSAECELQESGYVSFASVYLSSPCEKQGKCDNEKENA